MRRIILIVAFALVVGSGAVVTATQSGNEAPEAGALGVCATPIAASPVASPGPGIAEAVERSLSATPEAVDALATAADVVEASPTAQELDECVTPEIGTPAT